MPGAKPGSGAGLGAATGTAAGGATKGTGAGARAGARLYEQARSRHRSRSEQRAAREAAAHNKKKQLPAHVDERIQQAAHRLYEDAAKRSTRLQQDIKKHERQIKQVARNPFQQKALASTEQEEEERKRRSAAAEASRARHAQKAKELVAGMVRARAASVAGSTAGSVAGSTAGQQEGGDAASVASVQIPPEAEQEAAAVSEALSHAVLADDVVARMRIDSELRLIERAKRERQRKEEQEAREKEGLRDRPKVSTRSRDMARRLGGHDLRMARAMRRQRLVESEVRAARKKEEEQLTFRPRINEQSERLVMEKRESAEGTGGGAASVASVEQGLLQRLEADIERRRKAQRRREKQELPECPFRPQVGGPSGHSPLRNKKKQKNRGKGGGSTAGSSEGKGGDEEGEQSVFDRLAREADVKRRKRQVVAALAARFDPETGRALFQPNAEGGTSEIHEAIARLTEQQQQQQQQQSRHGSAGDDSNASPGRSSTGSSVSGHHARDGSALSFASSIGGRSKRSSQALVDALHADAERRARQRGLLGALEDARAAANTRRKVSNPASRHLLDRMRKQAFSPVFVLLKRSCGMSRKQLDARSRMLGLLADAGHASDGGPNESQNARDMDLLAPIYAGLRPGVDVGSGAASGGDGVGDDPRDELEGPLQVAECHLEVLHPELVPLVEAGLQAAARHSGRAGDAGPSAGSNCAAGGDDGAVTRLSFDDFCRALGPVFEREGGGSSVYLAMRKSRQGGEAGAGAGPGSGFGPSGTMRQTDAGSKAKAKATAGDERFPNTVAHEWPLKPEEEAELTFRPQLDSASRLIVNQSHSGDRRVFDRLYASAVQQRRKLDQTRRVAVQQESEVPAFKARPAPASARQADVTTVADVAAATSSEGTGKDTTGLTGSASGSGTQGPALARRSYVLPSSAAHALGDDAIAPLMMQTARRRATESLHGRTRGSSIGLDAETGHEVGGKQDVPSEDVHDGDCKGADQEHGQEGATSEAAAGAYQQQAGPVAGDTHPLKLPPPPPPAVADRGQAAHAPPGMGGSEAAARASTAGGQSQSQAAAPPSEPAAPPSPVLAATRRSLRDKLRNMHQGGRS